jgi:hypothetical protein
LSFPSSSIRNNPAFDQHQYHAAAMISQLDVQVTLAHAVFANGSIYNSHYHHHNALLLRLLNSNATDVIILMHDSKAFLWALADNQLMSC